MDTKVSIYDSCKYVPINEWEELLTPYDVFLSLGFLSLIETFHKNEISPNYIVLKDKNKVIGILYSQTFKLSSKKLKEYINHGNPGFNLIRLIKSQLANFINLKVGFLGNLFLTNEMGFKIHDNYWNKIDVIESDLRNLDSILKFNNLICTQFHPELSGHSGKKIFNLFLKKI